MERITVAIAGCGARGMDTYADKLASLPDRAQIVAAADVNPEKLELMRRRYGLTEAQCFASAEEMLAQPKLADVMFICTPDRCHYAEAKEALRKGYHLLLEKPISPVEAECRELKALATEKRLQVVVCHVLRYTPFYRKIKEIVDSGILGEVESVQANEQVRYWHQAHSFVRGNWRNSELSSCMILQKCCHDMDILLWLTGKHLKKVSSFGSLRHFRAENAPVGSPERCIEGCPAQDECPYDAVRFYLNRYETRGDSWPVNVVAPDPTEGKLLKALREGPYGRCVYKCDNDVVDHQVVLMELEDGLTVDFTMCAFTAHGGRQIRIMGTRGELVGDMEAETIRVMPFIGEEELIDVRTLSDDFSGHGGGDGRLVTSFLDLLQGTEKLDPALSSIDRSVESHVAAFAAEQSRVSGGHLVEVSL